MPLVVALGAQRCVLTSAPPLVRQPVNGEAMVAEKARPQPTVHTWPDELLQLTDRERLHLYGPARRHAESASGSGGSQGLCRCKF